MESQRKTDALLADLENLMTHMTQRYALESRLETRRREIVQMHDLLAGLDAKIHAAYARLVKAHGGTPHPLITPRPEKIVASNP